MLTQSVIGFAMCVKPDVKVREENMRVREATSASRFSFVMS